jgi:hypothetical protein
MTRLLMQQYSEEKLKHEHESFAHVKHFVKACEWAATFQNGI